MKRYMNSNESPSGSVRLCYFMHATVNYIVWDASPRRKINWYAVKNYALIRRDRAKNFTLYTLQSEPYVRAY